MIYKRWTTTDVMILRELYLVENRTAEYIADFLEVKVGTVRHMFRKHGIKKQARGPAPTAVVATMQDGKEQEFSSMVTAGQILGVDPAYISDCVRGKRPHTFGIKWRYKNDN